MQLEDLSALVVPSHLFASAGLGAILLLALLALHSWSAPTDARGKRIPTSGLADYGLYSALTGKMIDWPGLTRFGPVFQCYFLGKPMIVISGAANVRAAMNASHDEIQASLPSSLGSLLGSDNIMFVHGKAHTKQRRILLHAFTPTNLKGYTPRLGALADSHVAEWASTGVISAHKSVRRYVIQVAAELLMGFDARWTSPEEFERVNQLYLVLWNGFFTIHVDLPGTPYHKAMRARKELFEKITKSLRDITDRRAKEQLEKKQKSTPTTTAAPPTTTTAAASENNNTDNEAPPQGRSVIEVMLNTVDEEGNPLNHERIVAASTSLLLGAVDTTSVGLMMALRFLALHPEAYKKLQEEQANVVKVVSEQIKKEKNGSAGYFTDAATRLMPYTDAILKETLRLASPTRILFRKAVADYEVAGYVIPAGTKILINVASSTSHDERWINNSPELFRPERWLSEEGQRVGAWAPFGGGSRLCLGQQLALLEMKAVLAALGRGRYEIELLDKEEKWKEFPLMLPKKGMPLRVSVASGK